MALEITSSTWACYFEGSCSDRETAAVEAWLEEDPARRIYAAQLHTLWHATRERPVHADVGAAWEQVAGRLDLLPKEPGAGGRSYNAGPGLRRRRQEGTEREGHRARAGVERRSSPAASASPKLGRKPRQCFIAMYSLRIAAVILGVAISTALAVRYLGGGVPLQEQIPPEAKVFTTARGQQASIRLLDGTQIRLNVESRLTVPADFATGPREVQLEGEAFFEVAKDPERPFIVHAGGADVEVLGTAFGVRTYAEEDRTRVVVAEGHVALRPRELVGADTTAPADTLVLHPRQLGGVIAGRRLPVRRNVSLTPYLAWTEGHLVFHAASFDEVVSELERWFDLQVELTVPAEQVDRLTVSFTGEEYLSEILNVVAATLHLSYRRDPSQRIVTFSPEPETRAESERGPSLE